MEAEPRLTVGLVAAVLLAVAVSWIQAPYPKEMVLQHVPTALALGTWAILARRFPLSDGSALCLAAILLLHVLGARYLYSYVPYDDWLRHLFGADLTSTLGWRRNHYDRLVHLAFGALSVRPAREILVAHLRMPRRLASYAAFEFVLAVSAVYELVEWILSIVLAPEAAGEYNGQQGDPWDAQKDMALAAAGALFALALGRMRRLRRR